MNVFTASLVQHSPLITLYISICSNRLPTVLGTYVCSMLLCLDYATEDVLSGSKKRFVIFKETF